MEWRDDWPWFYNAFRPQCTGSPGSCQVCNGGLCETVIQRELGPHPEDDK